MKDEILDNFLKLGNTALEVFCRYCPFCGGVDCLKIRRKGGVMIQKECSECKGRFSFNPRQMLKQMKKEMNRYPNDRKAQNFYKNPMQIIDKLYPYKHRLSKKKR